MVIRLTFTSTLLCTVLLLMEQGHQCTTAAMTIGGKISLQSTNKSSSSTADTNTNASTSSNSTTTGDVNKTETNETEATTPLWAYIPDTISPEWGPVILAVGAGREFQFSAAPDDLESWQAIQDSFVAEAETEADAIAAEYGVTYKEKELGGIPVIDIMPAKLVCKDKIGVYTHGGGYVVSSAKSTLETAILFAVETGLRVISIDYTLAPHSKWQDTTDEVINVFAALAELGFNAKTDIFMFGDSAGGSMAASVTLKMRDLGMDMPAALVLLSPWSDITETGDTYVTLRDAEPFYTYENIQSAVLAYANVEDLKNPYVSPVYGDFTQGFPPTLIQGGTKELFVSNFVRLYQAIDQAGGTVKLDIYEGMPHVFQSLLPNSTESQAAITKARKWVKKYLLSA